MTTLGKWLFAVALWLAYGCMIGLVLAMTTPKTSTTIFAVTGAIAWAALISLLFKLKIK
jgi:hypothetical protein